MSFEGKPDERADTWKDFPPLEPQLEIVPTTDKPVEPFVPGLTENIVEIRKERDEDAEHQRKIHDIKRRREVN